MDFALSIFATLMLTLLLWLPGWVTPEIAARLQVMLVVPLAQSDGLAWGLAAAALPAVASLLLAGLVFRRPATWQRR